MKNLQYVFTWVLGLVLVSRITEIYAGTDVPVLIWGGNLIDDTNNDFINPFEKTSQEDFEKIVTKIVGGSLRPVLVFVKDDFCIEDLTKHEDSLKSLMDVPSFVYRPEVDSPVTVFENLPFYNCTSEDEFKYISEGQLILTNATDLSAVLKTFNATKESNPKLVGAITGRSCQYSGPDRIKRAVKDEPTPAPPASTGIVINETRILIYYASVPNLTVSDDGNITTVLTKNPTQEGNGTIESPLTLNFEYTVKNDTSTYSVNVLVRFLEKSSGYYTPEVLYKQGDANTTLTSKEDLSFPYNFSYHCSQNIRFGNKTFIRFDLSDFQVQIDTNNFGDAYDCVGFTSIPIWAGIFVTAILAIIMTWGLTMIMDIRTMDRFDDPKGKTITISATTE